MRVDWLIVGAGLAGATLAERIATQLKRSVLVIDQRDHVAGNAWDEFNEHGIFEHKYGPHIFHTYSKEVWDYLSGFTTWRPYLHRVLGFIDGKLVPLPFNLNSISSLFSSAMANRLTAKLIESYGTGKSVPILKLREAKDPDIRFLAEYVYRNLFEQYTKKFWGMMPDELSPTVTARLPISVSRDERYFQDTYQGIPSQGYGKMINGMLNHPNICVMLNTRWQDVKDKISFERMVFTGPIDEFFEFKYGRLPYRSLRFSSHIHLVERYQEVAVINFPCDHDYTRITEPKWITGQVHPHTTTLIEYPLPHIEGKTLPYYPVPTDANRKQYDLYKTEAQKLQKKVVFTGRLGDYMYYNMDEVIARSLQISKCFSND